MFSVNSAEAWDVLRGKRTLASKEMEELADSDPQQLFSIVATATVLDHEIRHFHDFMLSPLGSEILAARLSAATNSLQAMAHLLDRRAEFNVMPLPMNVWVEMGPSDRRAFLTSVEAFLPEPSSERAALVAPELVVGDPVADAFLAAGRAMRVVEERVAESEDLGDGRSISLSFVAEFSALAVQTQSIWTNFGESATRTFVSGLLSENRGVYGQVVGLTQAMQLPVGLAARLAIWSLITSFEDSFTAPQRFIAGLGDLIRSQHPSDASFRELADRWEGAYGLPSWEKVLGDSLRHDQGILGMRVEMAGRAGAPEIFRDAANYLDSYVSERSTIVREFLADPDAYCAPYTYLMQPVGRYPEPLVALGIGGIDRTREELEDSGFIVLQCDTGGGVEVPTLVILPRRKVSTRWTEPDFHAAQSMLLSFLVTDALCSRSPTAREASERVALRQAVGPGVRLLRLPA